MIKPIQFTSNSPFTAFDTAKTEVKSSAQTVLNKTEEKMQKTKDACAGAKKKVFNVMKGFNNVTGTTAGVIKGATFGGLALGAVGIVGKNIKAADNNIWKSASGIIKDAGKVIGRAFAFIPSIITKAPLENIKNVASVPKRFYGTYLKGHKGTAAIATVVGLGVLGFNVIKEKVKANRKNANIDHSVNMGHIK